MLPLLEGMPVPQLRLVGKEAGNRCPEAIPIVLIVGLIHCIKQDPHAFRIHHIDIVRVHAVISCGVYDKKVPLSFRRHRNLQRIGVPLLRKVDDVLSCRCPFPHKHDGFNRVAGIGRHGLLPCMFLDFRGLPGPGLPIGLKVNSHFPAPRQRNLLPHDALSCMRVRRPLHGPVGKAGREVAVVQNPDLHPKLLRLVQNGVHVRPPLVPEKIRVGPALYTDGTDIGLMDDPHILPQRGLVLPVLPEEG